MLICNLQHNTLTVYGDITNNNVGIMLMILFKRMFQFVNTEPSVALISNEIACNRPKYKETNFIAYIQIHIQI